MTDAEIIKASGEVSFEKIKAIYPHIVVSGDIDKPYYSIQYYDIEKKTMFDCYGSYKLRFVRKWLEELFEVIEPDIADLINRLQDEKEALIAGQETLQKALAEKNAEIEELTGNLKFVRGTVKRQKAKIEQLNTVNAEMHESLRLASEANKDMQAEIGRMKNNAFCNVVIDEETMRNIINEKVAEFELDIDSIKAEAIKEFAERLKTEQSFYDGQETRIYLTEKDLDNLVKEMVGEG